jgi:DNA-binding protein Fis
VLKVTGGNKAKAARLLRVDYKTMHSKTKKFGLQQNGGISADETQVRQ